MESFDPTDRGEVQLADVMPSRTQQNSRVPIPQTVGACTAFAAFTVAIVAGIASDNPVDVVLFRALTALAAGFCGGFLVGLVCDWLVTQEVRRIESDMVDAQLEASRAGSAGFAGESPDQDGLTGVDVLEDDEETLASSSVRSENRDAATRRREKNVA